MAWLGGIVGLKKRCCAMEGGRVMRPWGEIWGGEWVASSLGGGGKVSTKVPPGERSGAFR